MAVRFTKLFMTVSLLLTAVAADSPGIAFQGGKTGHAPDIVERLDTTATGKPALTSSKNVGVSEYGLDGHVDDVVFATKDGLTIFLLSSKKTLYRSTDGGKTWADQMSGLRHLHTHKYKERLHASTPELTGITHIIRSDHMLIFQGESGMHIVSQDAGRTYHAIWHPDHLGEFKLHPHKPNLILASTLTRRCYTEAAEGMCYKNLLISDDAGDSWRMIQEYVVQYDWAHNMKTFASEYPIDAIFASMHHKANREGIHQKFGKWDNLVDFTVSHDRFLTHEVLVPRGNRFLFTERYLAVAQVGEHNPHVALQLSSDGGRRFHAAELEYPMTQHSYTILDTSNDAVFLHVNHNGEVSKWGNVYISNSIGTNFSLTLPHNRRDENGKCDFEKLQSMEGVYVANYFENVAEMEEFTRYQAASMGQSAGRTDVEQLVADAVVPAPDPQIRTVMTFDRGGSWEYLAPPLKDAWGQPILCNNNDHPQSGGGNKARPHCSLHLHGITDVFGPFYSSQNAIGMLMATGNVGGELTFTEGLVNTYFSRDGGHEWFEVAKGSHIYEFGDHGGIIVMANDEAEANEISYSWNEGLTWETLKFTSTPVLVDNIMIEPRGASERFIVYATRVVADAAGTTANPERVGVVFALDFSQLHPRQCTGEDAAGTEASDFERWAPSATNKGDGCLMGRRVEYVRRKRDRQCYNPDSIEIKHFIANCECTEHDYECDLGYRRHPLDSGPCVRDPSVHIEPARLIPHVCLPGHHYHISNGYRKVAGDSCVDGVVHDMLLVPCPGSQWHHTVSHGGWTVLMVFVALALSLAALTYCQATAKFTGTAKAFRGGNSVKSPHAAPLGTPFPLWVPQWLAKPATVAAGLAVSAAVVAASASYHALLFATHRVRGLFGRGSGPYGESRAYPASSSKYSRMDGGGEAASLDEDDDIFGDRSSGAGGGKASRGSGAVAAASASDADGEDADFGVAADNSDDEKHRTAFGRASPDLLGLSEAVSSITPGPLAPTPSATSGGKAVPVLRPPRGAQRSHNE